MTPLDPKVQEVADTLRDMIEGEVEYMRINNLGDGEKQHNVKRGRAALAALEPEPKFTYVVPKQVPERARQALARYYSELHYPLAEAWAEIREATKIPVTKDTNVTLGVGDGSGNLFVHGSYESIKAVQKLIIDKER